MRRPGTYILEIALGSDTELEVGALGTLRFSAGEYCYVGSAMGGLDQRVSRHLSREKKVRWHIDRLTMAADSVDAYVVHPGVHGREVRDGARRGRVRMLRLQVPDAPVPDDPRGNSQTGRGGRISLIFSHFFSERETLITHQIVHDSSIQPQP